MLTKTILKGDSKMELMFSIIIYVFVALFGVCIGSFLNVCIYRLPNNESLTKRNSHCMTCGEEIKRRDLIPIISWCWLRGKCRNCGSKISPRYTVVEALNGLLTLLVFLYYNVAESFFQIHGIAILVYAILVSLLIAALIVVFFMDWDTQLINTGVVIFIAILAIPEYLICREFTGLTLLSQIIGALIISIPLLIIVLISHEKAMGMGDVYLMAAAGLFLGIKASVVAFLIALITASICGLIIKHIKGNSVFAFGPYLSIGIAFSAVFGNHIADWYISFTGLNEPAEQVKMIAESIISAL